MHFILFLGALGIGAIAIHLRDRLEEWDSSWTWGRLVRWMGQGVAVPLVIFLAYLSGLGGASPPVITYLANQSGLSWGAVLLGLAETAFCVIATFWGAVTLAWFLVRLYQRIPDEERSQFWALSAVWALLTLPAWLGLAWGIGWFGAGLVVSVPLGFILYGTLSLAEMKKRSPVYARAIGLTKLGKFHEAELEVIGQLEKHPDDFGGWLLLAELYAVHFHDMGAAEETIAQLIDQENLTSAQVATALHQLADWQVKIGQDPVGARLTLEEICRRLPGTNLDRLAARRLQQLPASREALLEQQRVHPIPLPTGVDPYAAWNAGADRAGAAARANALSERLHQDPNDVEARETFAWLLAESLDKVDLAFEQLGLLMEMPEQAEGKMARWLAMAAAWELRHRQNRQAARELMQRVVREYPESPEAFAAQRRLNLMDMESRLARPRNRPAAAP